MPKINQKEYEVLKEFHDKWKWIARDKDKSLWVFTEKPVREYGPSRYWWDVETEEPFSALELIDEIHLFQFIQWEDDEPYNIQELIDGYENDYKGSWEHAIEFSGEVFGESEETEVKSKQKLIEKWESAIEAAEFYGKGKEERLISYMRDFVDDLNQLDEPEVLSQEWIDEHKYPDTEYPDEYSVWEISLQNLLVPKQEELEVKIQELIETYKQEDGAYSNPENGWIGGFIEDLKSLLEEEQKYIVLSKDKRTILLTRWADEATPCAEPITEKEERDQLTEQEIKDYDPRYMIFAKPVEEVE